MTLSTDVGSNGGPFSDPLGGVLALTDAAGAAVERYTYDPYGRTVIESTDSTGVPAAVLSTSAYGNPFAWTGQRYDAGVKLYHFLFRSYSPELGRWLQRDPIGPKDAINIYLYGRCSPTGLVDPLGLFSVIPDSWLQGIVDWWGPDELLDDTGGRGYTYADCVGDCIATASPGIVAGGGIGAAGQVPTNWRPSNLGLGGKTRLITAVAAKCGATKSPTVVRAIKATRGVAGGIKTTAIGAGATAAAIEAACLALCAEF